ncbi:MAG TPA: sigma-70 region 4 domain-containing protein [Allosphingosinicella sp.]|nr:sigma-70 region 4 domain-containing protein [Allosphingosinicella sp.]
MPRRDDPTPPKLIERMEAIVARMPRLTREVFLASRIDGLSYEDIGRRTGLTVRQVERHLARALVLLDRGLERTPRRWWRL